MNREDIEEMYGHKPYNPPKRKYTGYAYITGLEGQVTEKKKTPLTVAIFKRNYQHLRGYRIVYEYNLVGG